MDARTLFMRTLTDPMPVVLFKKAKKVSTVLRLAFISKLTIFKVHTCVKSLDIKGENMAGSSQSSIGHWRLFINC